MPSDSTATSPKSARQAASIHRLVVLHPPRPDGGALSKVLERPLLISREALDAAQAAPADCDRLVLDDREISRQHARLQRADDGGFEVHDLGSHLFAAIVVKAATETPLHPSALRPEIPTALGDIVLRAMARARDDRPASLLALIEELAPFASQSPEATTSPRARADHTPVPARAPAAAEPTQTSAPRARPPEVARARSPRLALGLSVLAIAAAAVALMFATPPTGTPAATAAVSARQPATTPAAATRSAQPPAPGADTPPPEVTTTSPTPVRPATPRRAVSGWVYLGDDAGGVWRTRYFDGWVSGLPAAGTTITARGRSFVREAMPDLIGTLAGVRATIGPEQPLRVQEIARWQGSGYVWARVGPLR